MVAALISTLVSIADDVRLVDTIARLWTSVWPYLMGMFIGLALAIALVAAAVRMLRGHRQKTKGLQSTIEATQQACPPGSHALPWLSDREVFGFPIPKEFVGEVGAR